MKALMTLLLVLACAHCVSPVLADTEEFTVTVTGDLIVPLNQVYAHFSMSASSDILVRFVIPVYRSNGQQAGFTLSPIGDKDVPEDSGPHPDISDTTMTVFTALNENIYNDIGAKKLLFTGTATVTVKAKK